MVFGIRVSRRFLQLRKNRISQCPGIRELFFPKSSGNGAEEGNLFVWEYREMRASTFFSTVLKDI